ncbi:hypothetical protein WJ0W_002564 [Paenibacillus melissococcoides]|uniref:Uncharacterized protein n=1 Tax=Paenibacillus melissococcoides TaxID=2912268 RepID=A0ABM9G160_9BACL|nr:MULTISPECIES: hypothetical protein [Paenibacillus]MEB9897402.1 hypothetical protein [Bacillus cereus]CAH8245329.1 hypothetical protein WJ0W_002564 [Paenibacillus melissococcoides]CAH8710648.1 hypothetical protein WDD9_002644 [Paenibacillus melissococcoides]CAH8711420.1 hypothetical protein HTL2_002945 [Paenibacillus melissococcoides]GIO77846.1 hypothetical protein J6TS7_14560 [Paenibacillus dendritiformis]
MLFSRTVRLPSFMLVGEYCESPEEMRRACRTLPFLPGSGLLPPEAHRYSIGLGMNGLYFAGLPYAQSLFHPEQAKQLTFHSFQGGIYRVSPLEADAADTEGKPMEGLALPEAVLPNGRHVVYEFRRTGNTYAESRLYIPVGRLSAEAGPSIRFRSRCLSRPAVA